MKREEAIKLAIRACEETWNEKTCKQIRDALEQEPKLRQALEQEKGAYNALVKNIQCADAISRQAVLDELSFYLNDTTMIEEDIKNLPSVNPQEPKYCDRNICVSNEYNGIGCDECEVTKSQEPSVEIVKTEESNDNGTKYLNINVSDGEVKRNPDIVRLCSDVGILEYVKPRTGHWDNVSICGYRCSECGKIQYADDVNELNYCCTCGAKMIEPQERSK